ncbi:MAG: STAS domain-containing protein [Candidatus Wallbacteria bacterium]|nr:STAS domain-containing protein [Candidatus Wallbacteria bacterium]
MEIILKNLNDKLLIKVQGTVDLYSSPELREEIQSQLKSKSFREIIIDLGEVNYIDSSGIATLVEGLQVSGKLSKKFSLVHLTAKVRDVFSLARLEKVFTIYEDQKFDEISKAPPEK